MLDGGPGADRRASCRRASPCAAPATTSRPATCCSPPARGHAGGRRRARQRQRPRPCRCTRRRGWRCCPPATSWSTTAAPLRPGSDPREQPHDAGRAVREAGCDVVDHGIVRDDEAALESVLRAAAADVRRDRHQRRRQHGRLRRRQGGAGADRRHAWMQIAIKPAKPFAFGMLDGARRSSACRAIRSARSSASSCSPARRCGG